MFALCFFIFVLSTCTTGSSLSAQTGTKIGDVLFGVTKKQDAIPLDTQLDMKPPKSSFMKIHKNGFFSSENVLSSDKLSRLLDTISRGAFPVNAVPHVSTFKTSAITNAHDMIFFNETKDVELKRKIRILLSKIYDEEFDPDRVMLSTWNQYGCSEGREDATQDVYKFHCILASNYSTSYVIFIYDGPDLCHEEIVDETDGKQFPNDDGLMYPIDKPELNTNSPIRGFSKHNIEDTPSKQNFYQLKSDGKCLTLTSEAGAMSECTDESGEVASATVFRITGAPGNQKIEVFGTGKCLDREHCHSSTSNLRSSDCDHCGAIHWDVRSDGTLREDEGKNCVYIVASTDKVLVHHSSDGCTAFNFSSLGDSILMKSINYGDCLAGATFKECGGAPRFFVNGLSRHYQFQDTQSRACIDREHCHSSQSNMRLYSCDHCGAIHWSIEDTQIGEDEMKNCVNRGGAASAFVKHCTDGWERMAFEIVPSNTTLEWQLKDERRENFLPKPVVKDYIDALQSSRIRGARLLRNGRNGTAVLEIVQSVPFDQAFEISTNIGNFRVEFWVAHIVTYIPFSGNLDPREILARLISGKGSALQEFNLKYGAVDSANRVFEEEDGLFSLFVTNNVEIKPELVPHNASLLKRIGDALDAHRWWHRLPNIHYQSYKQSYYTFSSKRFYRALYWSKKQEKNNTS